MSWKVKECRIYGNTRILNIRIILPKKNSAMLDLIVKTSSNEDSIVPDCFCGANNIGVCSVKW